MGVHDYNVYNIIKRNARNISEQTALISGNQRINYREFLKKVDQLACGLLGVGVRKGDRIGILADNSLEFFYLYGATAKIGTIILPINWRLNPEEIKYIISDGAPKALFVASEFQDIVGSLISDIGFLEKIYVIGKTKEGFTDFNSLLENDGACPKVDVRSDDDYVIIHTAAVKGRPRGAVLTHQNIILFNLQQMYYWHLTKDDIHITLLPLYHVAGLGIALSVMQAGGVNIILPKFEVDLALKHIQEDKVTILGDFPPILKTLLDRAEETNCNLSSLRIVAGLDHTDTVRRLETMTRATFWIGYGQSETSGPFSHAPYFERLGSAGTPSFLAEVEIVDDYGNILGIENTGEIVVRGMIVFKGYWNLEKDNEYTFRDGWHHTGDVGYLDKNGYLWYKGRTPIKELIKSGGENVYPAEVEKVLLQHPCIEEATVIGIPDSQWGEAIKAVCVLKKGESLTEAEVIEFVAGRIARFKKPKYVMFVSNLPKTEDGLINREKVKIDYSGTCSV